MSYVTIESHLTIFNFRIAEVLEKDKAVAVTSVVETVDKSTGEVLFESHSTVFLRGAHGVGGRRTASGK